ncbi:MAG: hypothetical protein KC464_17355, partial [Myxococcales bacterium]|nr:hypothetical protein [Myxococcales bacterium]
MAVAVAAMVSGCGGGDAIPDGDPGPCPRATPGGAAWTPVDVPARYAHLYGAAGDTVIVQGAGVLASTDRGATWQVATFFGEPIERVDDFAPDPRTPGRIWLASAGAALVADDGVDFVDSYVAWPLAPDYAHGGELFATCNNLPSCRLLRQASPADPTITVLDGVRIAAIATFEAAPQRIVTLDVTASSSWGTLRVSVDGGASWDDADPASDVVNLRRGAGALELWATTTTGVMHSADGGASWIATAHPILRMLPSTATASRAFAVGYARDLEVTDDGGQSWTSIAAPYGVDSAVDTDDGAIVVATIAGVFRGDGATWTALDAPLPSMPVTEVVQAGATLMIATSDGNGSLPAWRSSDGATTWDALAGLRGFEIVPGSSDVVYASEAGAIVRSTDGGATWQPRAGSAWEVVPAADPDVVYGVRDVSDGDVSVPYLVRSRDGGDSFEQLDVVLSGYPSIRTDRVDPARLYIHGSIAGGPVATFTSDDQGDTWAAAGDAWWTLRPDATVAGRVWRSGNQVPLQRSDDAGATWSDVPGSPGDVAGEASLDDGSTLAFTSAGQVWELSVAGAWTSLGPAPGTVTRVASWGAACPDAITILTSDAQLFATATR